MQERVCVGVGIEKVVFRELAHVIVRVGGQVPSPQDTQAGNSGGSSFCGLEAEFLLRGTLVFACQAFQLIIWGPPTLLKVISLGQLIRDVNHRHPHTPSQPHLCVIRV